MASDNEKSSGMPWKNQDGVWVRAHKTSSLAGLRTIPRSVGGTDLNQWDDSSSANLKDDTPSKKTEQDGVSISGPKIGTFSIRRRVKKIRTRSKGQRAREVGGMIKFRTEEQPSRELHGVWNLGQELKAIPNKRRHRRKSKKLKESGMGGESDHGSGKNKLTLSPLAPGKDATGKKRNNLST